jgi:hypothetical protein
MFNPVQLGICQKKAFTKEMPGESQNYEENYFKRKKIPNNIKFNE